MDSLEKALQLLKEWEYDEAYQMLLRLADRDNAKAMLELGMLYVRGRGVCKNEVYLSSASGSNCEVQPR